MSLVVNTWRLHYINQLLVEALVARRTIQYKQNLIYTLANNLVVAVVDARPNEWNEK